MKKVFLGLVIGIALSGAAAFVLMPKVQLEGYNKGYAVGNKDGMEQGTKTGIAQGIAELQAVQQHQRDSTAMVMKKQAEMRKAALAKRKVAPAPIQNWHVIDGKITEPVVATKEADKQPEGIQ